MSVFFSEDSHYYFLEQQMRQPPGYRRRGKGIHIFEQMDWKSRYSYEEIIDAVISRMRMERLKIRLEQVDLWGGQDFIFKDQEHRQEFEALMKTSQTSGLCHTNNYIGAVFLLTAGEELWQKVSGSIFSTGIYFDRMRIGRVTLEQYILFHAAKDIYNGTKHVRLSELADRELIPDAVFRLIINGFVLNKCGIKLLEWEAEGANNG